MIEALTQDLGWLRVSASAHPFSADRALFAEMKESRPLVDIPSYEVFQLQTSLETLEEQGIARPDFERIGPADASVWADGVSEKFSAKSRQDLDAMFEGLPARERDYHKDRVKVCRGVGAQRLA